jgi:hypothetical protein
MFIAISSSRLAFFSWSGNACRVIPRHEGSRRFPRRGAENMRFRKLLQRAVLGMTHYSQSAVIAERTRRVIPSAPCVLDSQAVPLLSSSPIISGAASWGS